MRTVCHLSTLHAAGDARILYKECSTLAAAGFDVVYICPHSDSVRINGVRIHPVPVPRHGRLERMTVTCARVGAAALKERAQVYHFHDPELFPVGVALARLGHPVIYDAHEDLPRAMLIKTYLPAPARVLLARVAEFAEPAATRELSAVIVPADYMAERFDKAGAKRVVVIHNYPIHDRFRSPHRTTIDGDELRLVYAGSLSTFRGIVTDVEAMGLLPARVRARLILYGRCDPVDLLVPLAGHPGFARTEYRGAVEHSELPTLLAEADVGIATLHPTEAYVRALPTKLFEYLALGLPVIASDFPAWRDIVERHACGICVNPEDPRAIAAAIEYLHDNPEERARLGANARAASAAYTWSRDAPALVALYEEILREQQRRLPHRRSLHHQDG